MAKVNAVVVGAGGISGAWFPPLLKEKVDIVGVVDLNVETAKAQIAKYGIDCEVGSDLAAMLRAKKPDFVLNLTVPAAHCKVACTALRAGCHVLGEKPLANSMAEARRMVDAANDTGLLCMVSQSRRYEPRHVALANALAKGKIGHVTTLNCDFFMGCHFGGFRDEMESPLILDMAIHHFDLARLFSAADPVAVYAQEFNPRGSWYKGDVAANCIFEMSDGSVFSYRGSWCAEGMHTSWQGDWRIIGDKGTILYERDNELVGEIVVGKTGFTRAKKAFRVPDAKIPASGMHGALKEFLEALKGSYTPQGLVQDNIRSLAMVFGAIESSRKRRRIVLARN
ncbi:MAG: Gfo/Idh/MocA family protein [Kiritimatiellia bacterium]|jgi:predicted dehydrogenase